MGCERKQGVIYTLPGLLTSPVPNQWGSEASGSGRFRVGRSVWRGRYKAFEDGTDTGFRNVGQLQIDAGEIPKRTFSIFKSRRKSEIKNTVFIERVCKELSFILPW